MNQETREAVCGGLVMSLFLCFALALWVFLSYMEAENFNDVTGKNVSTWQAMWITLHVQEEAE